MGPGPCSLAFAWRRLSSPLAVLSPPASNPTWPLGDGHAAREESINCGSVCQVPSVCWWMVSLGRPWTASHLQVSQAWSLMPGQAEPVFSEDWLTSWASLLGERLCRNHREQ